VVLANRDAIPVPEIPFLQRVPRLGIDNPQIKRHVGRIDKVLVVPSGNALMWCPVETQAVYFSGKKMLHEFRHIAEFTGEGIPFPILNRRPDYRSSGPKRLLPQLQVKVPTLRIWGKKMAVVIDQDFFGEFSEIQSVNDISNAEIIWFVVSFTPDESGKVYLRPVRAIMTTLEDSIKALVAAVPLPKSNFEDLLKNKLTQLRT